jgi:hypothetical protein
MKVWTGLSWLTVGPSGVGLSTWEERVEDKALRRMNLREKKKGG